MSLQSHGHRILFVIAKLLLICSGIEKGVNLPIVINLPLVLILLVIFIIFADICIICGGFIWQWWSNYYVQIQSVCVF